MFSELPRPRRRFSAFAISLSLHSTLIAVLALQNAHTIAEMGRAPAPKYTVRLLYLQPFQPHREKPASGVSAKSGAGKNALIYRQSSQTAEAADSASAQPARRHYRQFVLPPSARVQPVKQTLVQPDLPVNIPLKNDFSLPAVLLWSQKQPPPFPARKFVAPALKEIPKVKQSMPLAPVLNPPNGELAISDLRIANAVVNGMPHLPRPPATTSPAHTPGIEPAPQIPQIVMPDPSQANIANVISVPDIPVQSSNIIALPPVNQVGPSGGSSPTASSENGGAGQSGTEGKGAHGTGASGNGAGLSTSTNTGSGSGGNRAAGNGTSPGAGSSGGSGSGTGSGLDTNGNGTGVNGSDGFGTGSGTNGNASGSGDIPGFNSEQMTKISLPKDGKYGVIILGSEAAAPYPESVGALGGKIIYTVYVRVGLRKSWILQYCLPKGSESKTRPAGTHTPLDAPYPFLIMRPNAMAQQEVEYVLIHGVVTAEGKFDQLSLLFPEDLDQKSLLLTSLKLWAFRPAKRDGEDTAVEILLIIPRQS